MSQETCDHLGESDSAAFSNLQLRVVPIDHFSIFVGKCKSNTKSVSLGFFVEHLFCSAFKTLNKAQGGMGQAKPNPSLSATSLVSRMFEIVAEFSKFQKPVSTGKKTPAKSSGYF